MKFEFTEKKETSGSYFEFSMGNTIAIISLKKTRDGLFNCRVDDFLQVVVSQILVYISYPVQVHFMKELE